MLTVMLPNIATLREKLMHGQRHVRVGVSTTTFRASAGATAAMFLTYFRYTFF